MITRLRLRDFQCHEKFDLELDPLLTVVVGPSDQGKSALLRALRWVSCNEPSGEAFKRDGATRCLVALSVDGHEIIRSRGKRNLYKLDGEEYIAFGTGVPTPIADLLRLSEPNFQRQHDAPLWFLLSAPQVSRELNAVVDLSVIDEVLSHSATQTRKVRSVVEISEQRLQSARQDQTRYAFAEEMHSELLYIETLETEALQDRSKIVAIERSLQEAQTLAETVDRSSTLATEAGRVLSLLNDANTSRQRCAELEELIGRTAELTVAVASPVPDPSRVEQLVQEALSAQRECREIEAVLQRVKQAEERLCRLTTQADRASALLSKTIGTTCPLCGTPTPSSPSSPATST